MSTGSTIIGFAGVAAAGATVHAFERLEGVGERLTPYQAVVYKNGSFAIRGVPAGDYNVRLGHYAYGCKTVYLRVDGSTEYMAELGGHDELDEICSREMENAKTAENPVAE